ncbi:MAG: beta-galactosidase trimerization domain-containing protein, partial [Spirochaetota bacterium]
TSYTAYELCDLIHLRGATAVAHYASEFYAGRPALTVNRRGTGEAWYIASRNEDEFLLDFYQRLVERIDPVRAYPAAPAPGVLVSLRRAEDDDGRTSEYRFLINFAHDERPAPALFEGEAVIYRSPAPNLDAEHRIDAEHNLGVERAAKEATDSDVLPVFGVQVRRLTH